MSSCEKAINPSTQQAMAKARLGFILSDLAGWKDYSQISCSLEIYQLETPCDEKGCVFIAVVGHGLFPALAGRRLRHAGDRPLAAAFGVGAFCLYRVSLDDRGAAFEHYGLVGSCPRGGHGAERHENQSLIFRQSVDLRVFRRFCVGLGTHRAGIGPMAGKSVELSREGEIPLLRDRFFCGNGFHLDVDEQHRNNRHDVASGSGNVEPV